MVQLSYLYGSLIMVLSLNISQSGRLPWHLLSGVFAFAVWVVLAVIQVPINGFPGFVALLALLYVCVPQTTAFLDYVVPAEKFVGLRASLALGGHSLIWAAPASLVSVFGGLSVWTIPLILIVTTLATTQALNKQLDRRQTDSASLG